MGKARARPVRDVRGSVPDKPRTRQVVQRFLDGQGIDDIWDTWLSPRHGTYKMGMFAAREFVEQCLRREFDRLHRLVKARPNRRAR